MSLQPSLVQRTYVHLQQVHLLVSERLCDVGPCPVLSSAISQAPLVVVMAAGVNAAAVVGAVKGVYFTWRTVQHGLFKGKVTCKVWQDYTTVMSHHRCQSDPVDSTVLKLAQHSKQTVSGCMSTYTQAAVVV